MAIETFVKNVIKEVDERIQTIEDRILGGSPKDFVEYRSEVKRLTEAKELRRLITDAKRRAFQPDGE